MNPVVQIFALIIGLVEFPFRVALLVVFIATIFPIAIILDDDGADGAVKILTPYTWKQALK